MEIMYLIYLWEVLKRAFTPAARVTDMLQILTASALPVAVRFAGIHLPQNASEDALAYIGLIAVSFIVIRLFWAPYAIWKDDLKQIGELKLELSKPERIELERMSKIRARNKIKLAAELRNVGTATLYRNQEQFNLTISKLFKLAGSSGINDECNTALGYYMLLLTKDHMIGGKKVDSRARRLEAELTSCLHGKIDGQTLISNIRPIIEYCDNQWPQDTGSRKPL